MPTQSTQILMIKGSTAVLGYSKYLCLYSSVSEENLSCENIYGADRLCNQIMSDYNHANYIAKESTEQILFLRYETLIHRPYATLGVLYAFLNLKPEAKLEEYLISRSGLLWRAFEIQQSPAYVVN